MNRGFPEKQGLYDPAYEHDNCGVGFIVNIKGEKSHQLIKDGIHILERLAHRGAEGADPKTGDGAGILIQMPDEFMRKVAKSVDISLPDKCEYGTGLLFLPTDKKDRKFAKETVEKVVNEKGQKFLGWRKVPVDNTVIGETAKKREPEFEMPFIGRGENVKDKMDFERKLYVIRKKCENIMRGSKIKQKNYFYFTHLSCRVFNYKGLLMPNQTAGYFLDLKDESMKTAIAVVHSRFATNVFPTWDLAQPFRNLAHNGEINTVRGNINWMKAKEGQFASELFGEDIHEIKPVVARKHQSDSATIDNAFELCMLTGRSLPHSMMMLVPGAWERNVLIEDNLKDFYKYHACFMEPWDGPAVLAFSDGATVGAILDRNGLRPARYIVTKDGHVIMSSEVGVLDEKPENIEMSGRLEPGKIFFIDTEKGVIINDEDIKKEMAAQRPYGKWLEENLISFDNLPEEKITESYDSEKTLVLMKAFGYSREDLNDIIEPLAGDAKDPVGAMGNDMPIAVLSKNYRPFFDYFQQLFAQVTNPAVDSIRERCVMSLRMYLGASKNIFDESPEHCHKFMIKSPLLTDAQLKKIKNIDIKGFKTKTISTLFNVNEIGGLLKSIGRVCDEAVSAIGEGYSIIILSDRGVDKENGAIPSLLITGAVHHELIRKSLRTQISIVLESGEPREIHHLSVCIGYGADAINPYMVYEASRYLIEQGVIKVTKEEASKNFRTGVHAGMLKVLGKMGISTVQSYCGAQIFEAIGVHDDVINKCFTGTPSRIGGVDFEIIEKETVMRHKEAFPNAGSPSKILRTGGYYQWKKDGEFHLWNPEVVTAMQDASRENNWEKYKEFAQLVNDQSEQPVTIRSLFRFKNTKAISIDEVESEANILKRFVTGAMSFGSISRGAHEVMAIAMNRLGGRSNTGEGGEDPARFIAQPNGDSARSSIKQVASGRFGVSVNYLVNADEIQIKVAQGAKPGEGGQLPGHKASEVIARTRYTTPGVTLISPPPHHDIYSIEDLKQLIFDLKNTNPRARISVKLVSEIGVGTVAAGVAKGFADMILISGHDGGTGASPKGSIMHAGMPWELGLTETQQTLVLNDLRSRVRLQTDGQMRTGRDVVMAAMMGAEEYGFATGALVVIGCTMLRHCHLNNCSLGVATQDEFLQKKFRGTADHLVNYFKFVAKEARLIMAELGVRKIEHLIGRVDMLEVNETILPWKAKKLDLSKILYRPEVGPEVETHCTRKQYHEIYDVLDRVLIQKVMPALESKNPIKFEMDIKNIDRTTGAMLSGEVCNRHGEDGLPEDTIWVKFKGAAGQSFGAWLASGVTFELEGMSNDYVGKGLSGGKIIIYPGKNATYAPEENVIIGNTILYGAIHGEVYIRGKAGERFCIRNSGAYAVVEGVGDHGCEYMTGGRVVCLGNTGRNFGAGMSGGIAYVYDESDDFESKCNTVMVDLDPVGEDDKETIQRMLANHIKYTGSKKAKKIMDNLDNDLKKFVKVFPKEFKRIIGEQKKLEAKLGLEEESDG